MNHRRGISLIELLVAATLIVSGLSMIGQLTVATGRMWQQTRYERMAMEELSNQLEWLVALSPQQRRDAIARLTPSPHAAAMLPGAELTARPIQDADGLRLEVSLNWDRPARVRPLTLVGWIDAAAADPDPSQEPSS